MCGMPPPLIREVHLTHLSTPVTRMARIFQSSTIYGRGPTHQALRTAASLAAVVLFRECQAGMVQRWRVQEGSSILKLGLHRAV